MRTKRTDGNTTYEYVYNGDKLSQTTVGSNTLTFGYDASGAPMYVQWNDSRFFYVTNIQGDVTAIVSVSGYAVVEYTYDAWGNILSITGTRADNLGRSIPLRYRGYVYDTETGLYYLQSRYYNPDMGRFINADDIAYLGAGGFVSYNLFAYCENNPVMGYDQTGHWAEWLTNVFNWVVDTLGFSVSAGAASTTSFSATAKGPTASRNTSLGCVSSKASGSLGYATGSFRGQMTQNDSGSPKTMIGGFGKASVLTFDLQNRIGTKNFGISKKDVLDIGTVTAQAGIQYKNGLGVALGAKASVAAARGTYCVDVFGWKVEVGISAQFLSYGYEFAYGALPEGGWGVKNGGKPGVFTMGYLIRITPA